MKRYLNFDLQLAAVTGGYRARVVNAPAGEAALDFVLPFTELELAAMRGRAPASARHVAPVEAPVGAGTSAMEPREVGSRLFAAIFAGEVLASFRGSVTAAQAAGAGLRLRLRLNDVPDLADLPWELLYDPAFDRFLALSDRTPVVRYLELPSPAPRLEAALPLRILALISAPTDLTPLDAESEWRGLRSALGNLEAAGRVTLERLDEATAGALQARLRGPAVHVLHFIGHGTFDADLDEGAVVLEDARIRSAPLNSSRLAALLADHRQLRLVVLNACEGARSSRSTVFGGVAQRLVQGGLPAVVAMRLAITDTAAVDFAPAFYGALADGLPVDAALAEARKALYAAGNETEWATPVLHLRAPDGVLWPLPGPSEGEVEDAGWSGTSEGRHRPQPAGHVFNVSVGRGAHQVAIGRDIVQIDNSVRIPTLPLLALLAVVLAVAAFLALNFLGPTRMGAATFNIAVAEIGELAADGSMVPSELGAEFSRRMFNVLRAAAEGGDDGFAMQVWHDSLPITVKRGRIGLVVGATPEERDAAAAALAERLDADLVLHGHLERDPAPTLAIEFHVSPRLRAEANASLPATGRYQLGEPLTIPINFERTETIAKESLLRRIDARATGAFWLVRALMAEYQGRSAEVLTHLRAAEAALGTWRERGEGKENLHYLQGRAALFLGDQETAETAFRAALASNPGYARAQVGLGSVYVARAQDQALAGQVLPAVSADLDQASAAYEAAASLAGQAGDTLVEAIAQLGQAQVHTLRGQVLARAGEERAARTAFETAELTTEAIAGPLVASGQYRLAAQALQAQGAVLMVHAVLEAEGGRAADAGRLFERSVAAYDACIALGERAPEDDILTERIIGALCAPQRANAERALQQLRADPGGDPS